MAPCPLPRGGQTRRFSCRLPAPSSPARRPARCPQDSLLALREAAGDDAIIDIITLLATKPMQVGGAGALQRILARPPLPPMRDACPCNLVHAVSLNEGVCMCARALGVHLLRMCMHAAGGLQALPVP